MGSWRIFTPQHAYEDRRSAYSRIYSFRDVVGLRTIAVLRNEHRVPFKELRRIAEELVKRGYEHWADTKLYVVNRQVHIYEPETGEVVGLRDGQLAILPIIDVINDVTNRVEKLKSRPIDTFGKIQRRKFVARNSWTIAGTRIPTATIRRYSEAGFSIAQILGEYPTLTSEDVEAAITHEESIAQSS